MHAMPPARSPLRPPAAKARSARFNRGPPGSAFFWMRRFRVAPLPASPGFRMMRGTRFSLMAMPLFRSSRSMRRQPQRPLCRWKALDGEPFDRLSLYLGVGFLSAEMLVETGSRGFHRPACLLDGADLAPMLFEEPEPHAWSWLKKARKFFSVSFSRSSPSTFFSVFTVS